MARANQSSNDDSSELMDVSILDRDFKLAVKPSERPQLERAVVLVDEKMRSIRDSGKIAGVDRIAVLAALQIANDLVGARDRKPTKSGNGANLGTENQKKVRKMNDLLEAELKRQENLF